jgi:pimeloyl-ACP methyl ester carboxylesterase
MTLHELPLDDPPMTTRTTWLRTSTLLSLGLLLACTAGDGDGDPAPGTTGASTGSSSGAPQDTSAEASSTDAPTTASSSPADSSSGDPSTASSTDDSSGSTTGAGEVGPDLREPGPHVVQTEPGSAPVGDGCTMPYDIFSPVDVADAPTVILAHGLQGNRGSMAGWAEHWASWGLRVVTPNLCHATIFDADHQQNGADLVLLAEHLDVGSVGLAGYSAGGVAAVIAAAARPDTPVLLGLDMVDSGGFGGPAAPSVTAPAHDIAAEPAMCNSSSNGVPVFAAIDGSTTVRLVDADHCDFQNPADGFCGLCSEPNDVNTPEAIQAAIYGLGTAALLWRLGLDDTGAQWWTAGGAYYDEMFTAGLLTQL